MFSELSPVFVGTRPVWTCSGALLRSADGESARVVQSPFRWVAGAWQSDVTIHPIEPRAGSGSVSLTARVTPDTLRRWSSVGLNPFLEACAQLQEYWRRPWPGAQSTLIWL